MNLFQSHWRNKIKNTKHESILAIFLIKAQSHHYVKDEVAGDVLRLRIKVMVKVLALAGVITLCSQARYSTLTGFLSTQEYQRTVWVSSSADKMLWHYQRWTCIPSKGISNTPTQRRTIIRRNTVFQKPECRPSYSRILNPQCPPLPLPALLCSLTPY